MNNLKPNLARFVADNLIFVELTFWVSQQHSIRFDISIDDLDKTSADDRADEVKLSEMIHALFAQTMQTYGPAGSRFDPSTFKVIPPRKRAGV